MPTINLAMVELTHYEALYLSIGITMGYTVFYISLHSTGKTPGQFLYEKAKTFLFNTE